MVETKSALIIANSHYEDADLRQLLAPAQDAEALARVLGDPAIGGFHVQALSDGTAQEVKVKIEHFFRDRKHGDLLLLYFSGHGIKDDDGQLYFATSDTRLLNHKLLRSTAVEASFIKEMLRTSGSRRQVLILDSCYSGAFAKALWAKGDKSVGLNDHFGEGRGLMWLTASNALQYSFEGGHIEGKSQPSVFTRFLVEALESGQGDLDKDGSFSLDELYDYVHARVVEDTNYRQIPTKGGYIEGKIIIARNPRPIEPAELPAEMQQVLDSPLALARVGAVHELDHLLRGKNKGLALAAQAALTFLANEDYDLRVRKAAEECLAAFTVQNVAAGFAPPQEKAEQERLTRERAEAKRIAGRVEAERAARAEEERLALEKAELERHARERTERRAAEAAEREQINREKAEAERLAAQKAAAERAPQEKAEQERLERERAEAAQREQLAQEKAEQERLAREKTEAERPATEKVAAERVRREQAAAVRVTPLLQPVTLTAHTKARTYLVAAMLAVLLICVVWALWYFSTSPNLLRSKIAVNEAGAVGSLRTINTAAVTYATTYGRGYPASLKALGPPAGARGSDANGADLIDNVLAEGSRSGYSFRYQAFTTRPDGWTDIYTVSADPIAPGTTGQRHFFTDQTGVIRFEINGPANENSPPIS